MFLYMYIFTYIYICIISKLKNNFISYIKLFSPIFNYCDTEFKIFKFYTLTEHALYMKYGSTVHYIIKKCMILLLSSLPNISILFNQSTRDIRVLINHLKFIMQHLSFTQLLFISQQ